VQFPTGGKRHKPTSPRAFNEAGFGVIPKPTV